jgi:hypothetical protein
VSGSAGSAERLDLQGMTASGREAASPQPINGRRYLISVDEPKPRKHDKT